jgi:hypothetical protein
MDSKTAAEKHAEAARAALKVTEEGIAALLAAGADVRRAAPFIAAISGGLAARNVAHVPENFAAEAVRLGLAEDLLMAKLADAEPPRVEPSGMATGYLNVHLPDGVDPDKAREAIAALLEDLATTPGSTET